MIEEHSFAAMGTTVECFVEAETGLAQAGFAAVEVEFERLETLLSRFRPESELSRLNEVGRLEVGLDLLRVVELALSGRVRTRGRFDPTVHDAVVAAGYDRTFAEVEREGAGAVTAVACGGRVTVDRTSATIDLAPGVRLDLGGIGKGYAVDRASFLLGRAGPSLVNAGGDLRASCAPEAGLWPVGVETPAGRITLALGNGALATSGRDRRRWRRNGSECHHLIDPVLGRPARSDLLRVSVATTTAVEAEVLAKALFLAGEDEAVAEAESLGLAAVLVTADGRTVTTEALS